MALPWRRKRLGAQDGTEAARRPAGSPSAVPTAVTAATSLDRGEQVLASAQEDETGHWVLLTTYRLREVSADGTGVLDRPWHEVDTGAWDPDVWALSVTFTDQLGPRQWILRARTGPGQVPEVFKERTDASVVLVRAIDLGPRRTARITIRKVLATRELTEQVLLGRGARSDDEELADHVRSARLEVRDQAGMPPI